MVQTRRRRVIQQGIILTIKPAGDPKGEREEGQWLMEQWKQWWRRQQQRQQQGMTDEEEDHV